MSIQPNEPIDDGFGNETDAIPESIAEATAALGRRHPPTNRQILKQVVCWWTEHSGQNDPIVKTAISWWAYLQSDEVSQFDAGMTMEQHDALMDRLEELGLEPDDD